MAPNPREEPKSRGGPQARNYRSTMDPAHDRLCALVYLIVGENRYARATLKSALNGYGFHNLTECESGAHALKTVQGGGIDAVVAEYEMPSMTGAEFVWHLRRLKNERLRRLPVVMVGNDAAAVHVRDAIDAGVNEFMPKPYSRRDLYFRLRRAVVSPKPFVELAGYAGPDRRADDKGSPGGAERRKRQATSVQLYALAGSEPVWIKTAKLGDAGAPDAPNPPAKPASEPQAKIEAKTEVESDPDAKSKPSFSVLAEVAPADFAPLQRKP